ncbi:MAG: hypothetical protein OEZ01_04935 [Candidatus Heimdallarchaeota archaeon]|nr:hypothetical protein [Candidatus Heimdallarchaeota archaeon]MDH5645327.1 hypothetical protein [Candidatus Heimdallarchaeota archaeon]
MTDSELEDISIDLLTSYDFIKEIYNRMSVDSLRSLGKRLEVKASKIQSWVTGELTIDNLKSMCSWIFITKKISKRWSDLQWEELSHGVTNLLHGDDKFEDRFNRFCNMSINTLKVRRGYEFAAEVLCYSNPDQYWLWGNWIWDPHARTGALPLVLDKNEDLDAPSYGEQYILIGKKIKKLDSIAEELGIREPNVPPSSRFETEIFLCAVFSVYMYTVLRMRMTNEFNTIMPSMPELLERLLGLHKKEVEQ